MMTAHCTPCIYCRTLGGYDKYCAYYTDTGKKRPYKGGDGCTARLILPPEERERYIAAHRDTAPITPGRDYISDDYVYDGRGIIDGWYWKGN